MDIIQILMDYMVIQVLVACLIVGYLYKNKTSKGNKNIPIVVTIVGVCLSIALQIGNVSNVPDVVNAAIAGMVSGFMSVGFHSVVKGWFEKQDKE